MKRRFLIGMFLLVSLPALGLGQSLTDVAKQEKERRKKIKESGTETRVITDRELSSNPGRIANAGGVEAGVSSGSGGTTAATSSNPATSSDDVGEGERPPVADIPSDVPLDQKLYMLERLKTSYQEQVAGIDAEIEKNNLRIAEIQEELVSTGGTGLPTAPQADLGLRNPADIPALRSEQQELRDKNQSLEAQKQSAKNDIIARARRAGIPSSYLNF